MIVVTGEEDQESGGALPARGAVPVVSPHTPQDTVPVLPLSRELGNQLQESTLIT